MDNDIRINKYLSESGFCSRRRADEYINAKRVTINDKIALIGDKVTSHDVVRVDATQVNRRFKHIYIALNKPLGIVCTTDPRDEDNIVTYINHKERIFPIGRLDKFSHGLILLTSDGDIVNKILRARNNHEKEYVVVLNKEYGESFIDKMSRGVFILDRVTKPALVTPIDSKTFKIILTEGRNRQIRRMVEALGFKVADLQRTRIMNITLGNLPYGQWRYLKDKELEELNKLTKTSGKTR